jgi:hypothetical protein
VYDERLDLVDLIDNPLAAAGAGVGVVRCDALADRLRLADIEHLAACVAEQVHPGLVWELSAPIGWNYGHRLRG